MKHLRQTIRNIAIMVSMALVIGTVSVSAGVTDNLGSSIDKILGPVNASLSGNFNTSSTNGKLNQMKKDVAETKVSMENLLAPYLSELTVWVDSTNDFYNGKTVSATNSDGKKETASFTFKNGHYEATFPKLVRNTYDIAYPFILSSGKQLDLAMQFNLVAGSNTKQLFGDLQKMSMSDIQAACKAGTIQSVAKVGDTVTDGTYTYTIIGINQDSPSDDQGNLLDKNEYGDVLTFMALGAEAGPGNGNPVTTSISKTPYQEEKPMNRQDDYDGGWVSSDMRNTTMNEYIEKLPDSTKKLIGYVQKVTGDYNGIDSYGSKVSVTGDRCFILSVKEVCGEEDDGCGGYSATKIERDSNFQYQYFEKIATTDSSRWFSGADRWWLRSPSVAQLATCSSILRGKVLMNNGAEQEKCVFPAFCIY